jgi:hypothetical protein
MPYSKEKVKKLAKLVRKYYSEYVLKFDIRALLNILKFDVCTLLNVLEFNICTLLNVLIVPRGHACCDIISRYLKIPCMSPAGPP